MIERVTNQLELDKYHQENVTVKRLEKENSNKFKVTIKNVKDTMSQLTEYDSIELKIAERPEFLIKANICELLKHEIVFKLSKATDDIDCDLLYNMTFHLNEYSYNMESAAVSLIYNQGIVKRLFPNDDIPRLPSIDR